MILMLPIPTILYTLLSPMKTNSQFDDRSYRNTLCVVSCRQMLQNLKPRDTCHSLKETWIILCHFHIKFLLLTVFSWRLPQLDANYILVYHDIENSNFFEDVPFYSAAPIIASLRIEWTWIKVLSNLT